MLHNKECHPQVGIHPHKNYQSKPYSLNDELLIKSIFFILQIK